MEQLALFFFTAMTAIAVENTVFTRALGLNKPVLFMKSPKVGMLYGAVFGWMAVISSFFAGLVNTILAGRVGIMYIRAPLYALCVAVVFAATYLTTRRWLPKLFFLVRPVIIISTFNTALFGIFYVTASGAYTFLQTVAYALGASVGYTIALLVIYYARKRLAISPIPRSFRGLPILLLYIGLLSLAIYGLLGHGLAT